DEGVAAVLSRIDEQGPAEHRRPRLRPLPGLDHEARRAAGGHHGDLAARSEAVATVALVTLDTEPHEAVDQLRQRHARVLPQLRVAARRREAGHRVQLVDKYALAVLDEEVDAREAGAVDRNEDLD